MPRYSTQCCKYNVVILVVAYTSYRRVAYGVPGVAKMAAQQRYTSIENS